MAPNQEHNRKLPNWAPPTKEDSILQQRCLLHLSEASFSPTFLNLGSHEGCLVFLLLLQYSAKKTLKTRPREVKSAREYRHRNGRHRGCTHGLEAPRVSFNCRLDTIYNRLGGESNERLSSSSRPVGGSVEGYLHCVHWREKSPPTVGGAMLQVEDCIKT